MHGGFAVTFYVIATGGYLLSSCLIHKILDGSLYYIYKHVDIICSCSDETPNSTGYHQYQIKGQCDSLAVLLYIASLESHH